VAAMVASMSVTLRARNESREPMIDLIFEPRYNNTAEPYAGENENVRMLHVGLAIVVITGCATSHPKIVSVGLDTYAVTFAGDRQGTNAAMAMSAASAYCDQMQKRVLLKRSSESGTDARSPRQDTVIFQCLSADEPVYSSLFDTPVKFNPAHPIMIDPKYYARASRLAHEEGDCVVHLTVYADGTAHDPWIERSSGYPRLDQACLDVINGLAHVPIFIPATKNGKPVQATTTVPINWALDKF
jgi:TonB family protein